MKVLNRAKALDGTGGYITSQSIKFENEKMFLYSIPFRQWVECDESTRSVNFEDMLDSQGNKIFASLSASGKGGDIMKDDEYYGIAKYVDCKFVVEYENCFDVIDEGNFEVIGIPE